MSENFAFKLQSIRPGFAMHFDEVAAVKVLLWLRERNIQFSRVIFEINPPFFNSRSRFNPRF